MRTVRWSVPPDARIAAEAGTATSTGEALTAGGAVVAAGGSVVLVCLTAEAASDERPTPIDIADTFYGTRFGDLQGWFQDCFAPKAKVSPEAPSRRLEARTLPEPLTLPVPACRPGTHEGKNEPNWGRVYATYTKFNLKTSRYYSGRTSMVIDLNKAILPQALEAVKARDSNHHIDEGDESKVPEFKSAQLDGFDVGTAVNYADRYNDIAYWRIRGREQQLIDSFGGAQSDNGQPYRTENIQRGVAKNNPLGPLFHDASTKKWGQLHPYTGD